MTDHYATLGVSFQSNRAEIKRAFRRKAVQLHPDKSNQPDATEKFIALFEAYAILMDARMRKRYNEWYNGPRDAPPPAALREQSILAQHAASVYSADFARFEKEVLRYIWWHIAVDFLRLDNSVAVAGAATAVVGMASIFKSFVTWKLGYLLWGIVLCAGGCLLLRWHFNHTKYTFMHTLHADWKKGQQKE